MQHQGVVKADSSVTLKREWSVRMCGAFPECAHVRGLEPMRPAESAIFS